MQHKKETPTAATDGVVENEDYFDFLKKISKKQIEKQFVSEFEVKALGFDLIDMLYDLLPKQADEVIRAIKANIPIMIIDNVEFDLKIKLQMALRNAGAIILPECIMDNKSENVSFLSVYLNVK